MHECAHGISIHKKNLDKFIQYANSELADINFNEGVYEVDFLWKAADSNLTKCVFEIGKYPDLWGQGNTEPLFCIEDIYLDKKDIQLIGSAKDTLKFEKNGLTYIQFKATELIERLEEFDSMKMTIIGKANLNNWLGKTSPQIFIEDCNIEKSSIFDF